MSGAGERSCCDSAQSTATWVLQKPTCLSNCSCPTSSEALAPLHSFVQERCPWLHKPRSRCWRRI